MESSACRGIPGGNLTTMKEENSKIPELKRQLDFLMYKRAVYEGNRLARRAQGERLIVEALRQQYHLELEARLKRFDETTGGMTQQEEDTIATSEVVAAELLNEMQRERDKRVSIRQIAREMFESDSGGNQRYVKQVLNGERRLTDDNPLDALFGDAPVACVERIAQMRLEPGMEGFLDADIAFRKIDFPKDAE